MVKKVLCAVCLLAAAFMICPNPAPAKWPDRPIILVVPWPPANDPSTLITNAMAPIMSNELGVAVKVVNQAGGAGVLGTHEIVKANPDGYTFGLVSVGPMISQVLMGTTPYKTKDLKPLGMLWSSAFTLACRAKEPYRNLKELAEHGKTKTLRLAHWGLGAVPTLIAMNAAKVGGFKWRETAYKDLNALLLTSGDADVATLSTAYVRDYVAKGDLRILACMLPDRLAEFPDVPTVAEQGFGEAYSIWFGLFAPAATPDDVALKFREVFMKTMAKPEIQEVIKKTGVVPHPGTPQDAKKQMEKELAEFGPLMKELGLIKDPAKP